MMTPEELRASPLFSDISYESYLAMYHCFHAISKTFRPEETVCDFSAGFDQVGIIEHGEAVLIRIDENGVETVMETLGPGSVFGRTLVFSGSHTDTLEVISRTRCDVLFFDYAHLLRRCERACDHHSILVQNMLRLMADKARSLSERVDILSRRSIREKLLCFFHQQSVRAGSPSFRIPFSLSMLADYIATDRSAMMREMKKLRDEGVLSSDGRQIRLLQ